MAGARASLGLIAAAAMLGSHWVAYLVAAPDPHERAHLLEAAGHSYWPTAITIALAAALIGIISFVGHRLHSDTRSSRGQIFGYALPRFLGLQVGGFMMLELVERLTSGHGLAMSGMFLRVLLIGIAVQLLAALLCALVLVLAALVVERVAARLAPVPTATSPLPLVSLVHVPCLAPATGAHTLRGPPLRA